MLDVMWLEKGKKMVEKQPEQLPGPSESPTLWECVKRHMGNRGSGLMLLQCLGCATYLH